MARDKRSEQPNEVHKAFEEAALNDFPNPDRIGCPGPAVLRTIALKTISMRDPAITHVGSCSPCFRELRQIKEQIAHRKRLQRTATLAASVVLLSGVLTYSWRTHQSSPDKQQQEELGRLTLDLRPFSVTRGETAGSETDPPPLVLTRSRLALNLLLRPGSQEGLYDIQILDDRLHSVQGASGSAAVRNGITAISTELDLRQLAPGPYTLAFRPQGASWRYCPVRIE